MAGYEYNYSPDHYIAPELAKKYMYVPPSAPNITYGTVSSKAPTPEQEILHSPVPYAQFMLPEGWGGAISSPSAHEIPADKDVRSVHANLTAEKTNGYVHGLDITAAAGIETIMKKMENDFHCLVISVLIIFCCLVLFMVQSFHKYIDTFRNARLW